MDRNGSNVTGFRTPAGSSDATRKLRQEAERRVTAGELAKNFLEVQRGFERISSALNDRTVRIEALLKTLYEAGIVQETAFKANLGGLKKIQLFVTNIISDSKLDMLAKVKSVVEFNKKQPDDFKIKDSYFPVRNYLVLNPDKLSLDEVGEIALAFGFTAEDVDKIMADAKVVEAQNEEEVPSAEQVPEP